MFSENRALWFFFSLCVSFQIIVIINSIVSHDVIWSLEVGKRLYSGGSYLNDFFETNPPLLYYLHGLIVKASEITRIKPVHFFYGFLLSFTFFCFAICVWLTQQFYQEDRKASYFLLAALALCLGFVVNADYGQKEQIMLLFSLPYFFLNITRIFDYKIRSSIAFGIGLFAGIGFAFKPPFFFIPFILAEMGLVLLKKNFKVLLRWDVAAIFLVQCFYLISMLLITPSYIHDVLPVILATYVPEQYTPLSLLLSQEFMLFFYINAIMWCWCYQKNRLNQVISYFFLVSFGFAISYLLQGKGWRYQGLPLYVTNILLASQILLSGFRKFKKAKLELFLLATTFGMFFLILYIGPIFKYMNNRLECVFHSKCDFNRVIDEVRSFSNPNDSFFMFSSYMQSVYFMHYAPLQLGSRYASLWPVPGLVNKTENKKLKSFVQQTILEDFIRFKPKLVLVNTNDYQYSNFAYIKDKNFNYLTFMKQNDAFQKLWKNYTWVKHMDYGPMVSFDLYIHVKKQT